MDPKDRKYQNKEISVFWKPGKCIHASVCYTKLLDVFNPIRRPWVNMEGAPSEKIIEVVNQCPTEALTWMWNDQEKNKNITEKDRNHVLNRRPELITGEKEVVAEDKPIQVRVMRDGPVVVEGNITIYHTDGREQTVDEFTSFCRCGESRMIPFCDGTHRKQGFSDKNTQCE